MHVDVALKGKIVDGSIYVDIEDLASKMRPGEAWQYESIKKYIEEVKKAKEEAGKND